MKGRSSVGGSVGRQWSCWLSCNPEVKSYWTRWYLFISAKEILKRPFLPKQTTSTQEDIIRFFFVSLHAVLWQACCSVFRLFIFLSFWWHSIKMFVHRQSSCCCRCLLHWLVSLLKTYTHKKQKRTSFKGWRGYPFYFFFWLPPAGNHKKFTLRRRLLTLVNPSLAHTHH